jgi:hypothetical protein
MRHVDYVLVPVCVVVAAGLATLALVGDSMTFDESVHLTAGMSHLRDGDFRLLPETPPLAQMWAVVPLLLMDFTWPSPDGPEWRQGDAWTLQRVWLSQLNDGEHLLKPARGMMVLLLVATCLVVFFTARQLFGPSAGRLALILAALSPTLLAHGHLVTIDLPATLCFLLVAPRAGGDRGPRGPVPGEVLVAARDSRFDRHGHVRCWPRGTPALAAQRDHRWRHGARPVGDVGRNLDLLRLAFQPFCGIRRGRATHADSGANRRATSTSHARGLAVPPRAP